MTTRAVPVVISAPSGTGKTTLARRLVEDSSHYVFSVSVTTRPPRKGERDGVDYHFVTREDFEKKIATGAFAEWADVHGRLYGTSRAEIDVAAGRGEHAVLDIDVQGACQIRESFPDAKLIFVLPPSVGIMMNRLIGRGTEDPANIARRLQSAQAELQAVPEFDYVVVNDDLERCLEVMRAIVDGRGGGGAASKKDVEDLRAEIVRILEDEYLDYVNVTE